MMTKELQKICDEYNFNQNMRKMLTTMEMAYDILREQEKEDMPDQESMSMVEWLVNNSDLDVINDCTEKEKFLFALGVLAIELGSRLQL